MKRRDFLKGAIGVVTGVVILPSVVKPKGLMLVDVIKVKKQLEKELVHLNINI